MPGRGMFVLSMLARKLPPPWPMVVTVCLIGSGMVVWWLIDRPRELRQDRRAKGLCVRYGYNLRGNVNGLCPECGQAA